MPNRQLYKAKMDQLLHTRDMNDQHIISLIIKDKEDFIKHTDYSTGKLKPLSRNRLENISDVNYGAHYQNKLNKELDKIIAQRFSA